MRHVIQAAERCLPRTAEDSEQPVVVPLWLLIELIRCAHESADGFPSEERRTLPDLDKL